MNGDLIIENRGLVTGKYFIPPFTLWEGETVIIKLMNDHERQVAENELAAIFTGQQVHHSVYVQQPLTLVPRLFLPGLFKRMLVPFTVGHYLQQHANSQSKYYDKIYEDKWIKPNTPIAELDGSPRKLLTVYAALSRSENILFDLVGVDPKGADKIFSEVSEYATAGGAAMLIDVFDDLKDSCSVYIEATLI